METVFIQDGQGVAKLTFAAPLFTGIIIRNIYIITRTIIPVNGGAIVERK
jgi:hypothetical protein